MVRKHYLVVTTDFVGLFEVGVAGTECLDKGFVVDVRNFSRPKVVWPRLASGVASIQRVFYARFVPFQEQGISLLCWWFSNALTNAGPLWWGKDGRMRMFRSWVLVL